MNNLLLGLFFLLFQVVHSASPTVTLDSGVYVGLTTQHPTATPIVNKYLGLPFSDKVERFAPPRTPQSSTELTYLTKQPAACVQQFNFPDSENAFVQYLFNNPPAEESEDCLYLNVFTPANADGSLAVMFWILPGAYQFGAGAQPPFDGTNYAATQNVVIVAPNHRTNVFGFPGDTPDVPLESRNLGIQDQRMALDWVQKNIAKFGGDPNKVTIFGESSGAVSVDYLTVTEAVNPPFRAAIMQSGTALISPAGGFNWGFLQPSIVPGPPWQSLARALNCSTLFSTNDTIFECIKAAPAADIKYILEHQRLEFPVVVADNKTVASDNLQRRQRGQIANVPILVGSNSQEARLFLAIALTSYLPSVNLTEDAVQLLVALNPDDPELQQMKEAYSTTNFQFIPDLEFIERVATDLVFNCPAAQTANASAGAGYKTWRYLYNGSFPDATRNLPNGGVAHASELPLVWGNFDYLPGEPLPEELELSKFIQTAWANFAKDPYQGPGWSEYTASTDPASQIIGQLGGLNPVGLTEISANVTDGACWIYTPPIDLLASL